jgi:two-component system sensor histidine kinase RpfC
MGTKTPSVRAREVLRTLGEVTQAQIRIGLHTLFVVLTFAAYAFDPRIPFTAVVVISAASFVSAFALYFWAVRLQKADSDIKFRRLQRAASILSDNTFVTAVLAIGGQSTAGLWTIYIWTSIGYGVRYGTSYLHANVAVSAVAFALMAYLTPFWNERPPFVLGMLLGMVLVPVYTGFLIRQLHKAVQEREIAYTAKSEFLARMSHELRTPLHAIISTAELLKGKSQSAVQNDYVDTISLSSTTLLDLINRVLDLSKFESGQIGLAQEQVNIYQLLADAVNIFYQQGQSKGVAVRLNADLQIPLDLRGSPSHLKEVFLNILGNAVKFTDSGHVEVSAAVISKTPTTTRIRFEVLDTGCGISERDLARIFEPFMQSDSSITRRHGGSGLGTSFSREIIRLMGGDISINSTVGLGTTVRFVIPFEKCSESSTFDSRLDARVAVLGSRAACNVICDIFPNLGLQVVPFYGRSDLVQILSDPDSNGRIDAVFVDADSYGHILPAMPSAISTLNLARIVPVIGFGSPTLRTNSITSGYCAYFSTSTADSVVASLIALVKAFSRNSFIPSSTQAEAIVSKPLNILVADDNATNRKIAQVALEQAGHRCTLVDNGDDALFALNDVAFDAALLDMHMPGRDGIEVAKIYRFAGFDRDGSIPIILLTADCTNEAREDAESAGITCFLTKPILPSEIVRAVERVVGAYRDEDCDSESAPPTSLSSKHDDETWDTPETGGDSHESAPVIDQNAVAELVALMSKAEQNEFFLEFCEDMAGYICVVESVKSASDVGPAREAMHALAGAALIIGASKLAETARRIEKTDPGIVVMKRHELLEVLTDVCNETGVEISRLFLSPSRFE